MRFVSNKRMFIRACTTALLCIVLVGCAGSGRPTAPLPAVRVSPPEKIEDTPLYADRTSQTVAVTGAMFGFIGGMVGGAIAAGSIHAGQKRIGSVTRQHRHAVAPIIRRNIEGALAGTGKLPASPGKAGAVELRLKSVNHGLGHSGGQRFAPLVAARYELWDAKGKRIYKGAKGGTSEVGWTLMEYQAKPELYLNGLERASQAMGRDLAVEMIDELEEWLE